MERLKERLSVARQALDTLVAVLKEAKTPIVRDACIQRFEYSFEAVWKTAQLYLKVCEGLEVGSPKSVIRASMQVGLMSEEQSRTALRMTEDRNLIVHTYNEALAEVIYSRIADYAPLMELWVRKMQQGLEEKPFR